MPYPKEGESKSAYISRCIPYVIKEGTAKDNKQAAAICYSMWEKNKNESITNKIDIFLNEAEEEAKDDLKEKIFNFFKENKNPPDKKFHSLAEKLGIDPDNLEAEIYSILSSFLANGRFNESDIKEEDIPADELKMGIEVEKEHTILPLMAKRIAMDHLAEFKGYYSALKEMENKLKNEDEAKKAKGE